MRNVKDNRPVNLDIGTIDLPLPALASITHRVTGVGLVFGTGILLWLLATSLSGPEGFEQAVACMDSVIGKLLVWGTLSLLIYHTCAGIKHLIMDMGIGETLEGGQMGAKITFGASVVLILLAGLWIW